MRRHCSPQPPLDRNLANREDIARPIEPADRHARRLGILGHVECRLRKQTPPVWSCDAAALVRGVFAAAPPIDLAWPVCGSLSPAAALPTIAA
jgi:hypothetical protein